MHNYAQIIIWSLWKNTILIISKLLLSNHCSVPATSYLGEVQNVTFSSLTSVPWVFLFVTRTQLNFRSRSAGLLLFFFPQIMMLPSPSMLSSRHDLLVFLVCRDIFCHICPKNGENCEASRRATKYLWRIVTAFNLHSILLSVILILFTYYKILGSWVHFCRYFNIMCVFFFTSVWFLQDIHSE